MKSVLTQNDLSNLVELLNTCDNFFDITNEQQADICEKLRIGGVKWCRINHKNKQEEHIGYTNGDQACFAREDFQSQTFPCNQALSLTIRVYPKSDALRWTEDELKGVLLFMRIMFIHGSRRVLADMAEISENSDRDSGIPNLNAFMCFGSMMIAKKQIGGYAAIYFNIRNYKLLNKTFGFKIGSKMIVLYCKTVAAYAKKDELIARLGGDNFVALIKKENLSDFLSKMEYVTLFIPQEDEVIPYTLSVHGGIAMLDNNVSLMSQVMDMTSKAYSLTKLANAADIIYYDENVDNANLVQKEMEKAIPDAIENGDFLVYYQPKVSISDKKLVGAEALVRWSYKDSILQPMTFIPMFEQTGAVRKLDMYMLKQVCIQLKKWIDESIEPVPISVNFSKKHLVSAYLADRIIQMVDFYKIPHNLIEIEFTETAYIDDYDNLFATMYQLNEAKISTSMDDFGSGYSSINLLENLKFDILKLDRSLLYEKDADMSHRKKIVLKNTIIMAKELNMSVVSEGVETITQLSFLCESNCDIAQGFLFDQPLPLEEFSQRLKARYYI